MDTSYRISFFHNYWDLFFGLVSAIFAILLHLNGNIYLSTLFASISIGALSVTVSEIAEILAERLQEPYGSFVLTFSAVAVEIILLFMILLEVDSSPEAVDTVKSGIISAVIVDMNVLLGLAVFIGGLSYKEQMHNQDTSRTYTTILFVSAFALLVPSVLNFTSVSTKEIESASLMIATLLLIFYIVILIFQTRTHVDFFQSDTETKKFQLKHRKKESIEIANNESYIFSKFNNIANFMFVFILIAIIGFMAEVFAKDGIILFREYNISAGVVGLIIATIAVAPEIMTAIRAAKNNQIQRVVNIAMGASTVSILVTVPALMALAYSFGIRLTLDFNALQIGALLFTIILAWKTTDNGETNYFEGMSHLMFFACFVVISIFY
jgi:Ca2+:H+ antiporter